MTENELSKIIFDGCFQVHRELGPGLFESVYEECLYYELVQRGLLVERQKELPVFYKEVKMEIAFRADLIVEKKVIVEKNLKRELPQFIKNSCSRICDCPTQNLGYL